MSEDRFHLKIDAHGRHEGRGEGIVRVAEQKRGFAHGRVADDQQLKHVVEVLVRGLLLKFRILARHLTKQILHNDVSLFWLFITHTHIHRYNNKIFNCIANYIVKYKILLFTMTDNIELIILKTAVCPKIFDDNTIIINKNKILP